MSFDSEKCLISIDVFFNVVDVGDDSIFVLLIPKVICNEDSFANFINLTVSCVVSLFRFKTTFQRTFDRIIGTVCRE